LWRLDGRPSFFFSFGLLAPHGATAIISLAVFAAAVSSGFFLIEEMNIAYAWRVHRFDPNQTNNLAAFVPGINQTVV
jgi:hypothetical protein